MVKILPNDIIIIIPGKIYTLGGVQSKQVDQYDVETDTWADFFPSLRHCRVAHGAVADTEHDTLYVTGGSAKVRVLLRGRIGQSMGSIEREDRPR